MKLEPDREGLPHGSPERIDPVVNFFTDDPMGKQGLWHFPSKKVTRRKKCRNHGNTFSFSVNERRERHCGQSREEDGGNVKNLEDQM